MSEKRFSWIAEKIGQHYGISIRDGDKEYTISDDFFKSKDVVALMVELLNEQQATIDKLEEENEQLRQQLKTICNTCCYDCEEKWCEK